MPLVTTMRFSIVTIIISLGVFLSLAQVGWVLGLGVWCRGGQSNIFYRSSIERGPKILFVSTSSTTITSTTTSWCFVSSTAAALTACARKRRNILAQDGDAEFLGDEVEEGEEGKNVFLFPVNVILCAS